MGYDEGSVLKKWDKGTSKRAVNTEKKFRAVSGVIDKGDISSKERIFRGSSKFS